LTAATAGATKSDAPLSSATVYSSDSSLVEARQSSAAWLPPTNWAWTMRLGVSLMASVPSGATKARSDVSITSSRGYCPSAAGRSMVMSEA
jgi:hypothetical protein